MISNREPLIGSPAHEVAIDCLESAIDAVQPEAVTTTAVSLDNNTLRIVDAEYDLTAYDEVVIVGGGKAAAGVTEVLAPLVNDHLSGGIVVTKHRSTSTDVKSIAGDHPIPTETNIEATAELSEVVQAADEQTLVLFVLTGGASALLTDPAGQLGVDDIRAVTEQLLESGVPIQEINTVRKHLSDIKGGQLARRAAPATVVGLIMSDVVGNDLSTIGSGPTVPDETTYSDALAVFEEHDIAPPDAVRAHLTTGIADQVPETPFPGDFVFHHVENHLIADNTSALNAARSVAENAGYTPTILSKGTILAKGIHGEAKQAAKSFVEVIDEIAATGRPIEPPAVLLAGGECTVTVSEGGGDGGPNQEFALSAALEMTEDVVIGAVDTDGEDGSSDVAGAIVDFETVTDTARARSHLENNDAGTYLANKNARIRTGPTGTNVNDIFVGVVPAARE
jgi:hydroxypyruvate reductase